MPAERGASDFAEVARGRGDFDRLPDAEYGIEHRRSRDHSGWTKAGVIATIVIQVGALAWYGGRLEQRVTNNDRDIQNLINSVRELSNENNRQAQLIAGNNVAYQDIIRRLESIDRTMSSINERRR